MEIIETREQLPIDDISERVKVVLQLRAALALGFIHERYTETEEAKK